MTYIKFKEEEKKYGFIKISWNFMGQENHWYEWKNNRKIVADEVGGVFLLSKIEEDSDETRFGSFNTLKECQMFLEKNNG